MIWTLAWDAHAILQQLPLFDANLYFPETGALRFTEHMLGIGLVALPFEAAGGPVFAYWCVWLLAFPLNAVAMYALAWSATRDRSAAFIAGLIYAFCFFRMHHAHGHLQLLWTWPLPLIPLAIRRWLDGPTAKVTAAVTALVMFQMIASWYLAVIAGLSVALSAAVLVPGRRLTWRHAGHAAAAAVVAAPAIAWLAAPYLSLQAGGSAEAAGLSADLKGYLLPPANTWLGRLLPAGVEARAIWGEQTLYAGLTTLALAAVGAVACARTGSTRVTSSVLVAGLVALVLSFGPSASGWAPYDLLAQLPGLSLLRAPARLAVLVMLAVALLAAYGVVSIRRRLARASVVPPVVACVALGLAILAESFVVDFPGGRPKTFPIPPAYVHLATLPAGGVLSLPAYRATPEAFRDSDYLLFSTAHWLPVVNGYGRQEPAGHAAFMQAVSAFPAPAAVETLRRAGVRYVVLNSGRASELRAPIAAARSTPGVTTLGEFGADVVFEIRP